MPFKINEFQKVTNVAKLHTFSRTVIVGRGTVIVDGIPPICSCIHKSMWSPATLINQKYITHVDYSSVQFSSNCEDFLDVQVSVYHQYMY